MSIMSSPLTVDPALIAKVTDYIKVYMANYDPSHDYSHIKRVVHLAQTIQAQVPNTNRDIVTLAALMHDVGDRKYLKPGEDASRMIYTALTSLGASEELAEKIQVICLGVSYSSEIKDLARVRELIKQHPELAVVQDADRLDAIGAVGIGRVFAFGGAKGRGLADSIDHFEEKLLKLETMMKTDVGREMARERTERLRLMQEWWKQETEGVE
ncbi:HD domain-containing protein [Trichoderma simmonsii]|uniref:HD domain-containing protein n=1 Tax=Trichoderma simmonsii TaxID=1491479 RepID=A0A8G0LL42_9HYPO|nr:HD domain-containing protein [Trichoderma simmonsii]